MTKNNKIIKYDDKIIQDYANGQIYQGKVLIIDRNKGYIKVIDPNTTDEIWYIF